VPHRVFLLSPASCAGRRCALLLARGADFELAQRIRRDGAPLGEVFSFLSALYFRGKLAYARRFASAPDGSPGVFVITPDRGLVTPETTVRLRDLRAFAGVPVDPREPRYARPLRRAAEGLRSRIPPEAEVVLLGSIATSKYAEVLQAALDRALLFPIDFVGRGDMSRGGLMLRAARSGRELDYCAIDGATRRGSRPPRLVPVSASRHGPF
jgi:hypothetical protein